MHQDAPVQTLNGEERERLYIEVSLTDEPEGEPAEGNRHRFASLLLIIVHLRQHRQTCRAFTSSSSPSRLFDLGYRWVPVNPNIQFEFLNNWNSKGNHTHISAMLICSQNLNFSKFQRTSLVSTRTHLYTGNRKPRVPGPFHSTLV